MCYFPAVTKKPLRIRWSVLAVIGLVAGVAAGCGDVNAALEKESQARQLAANLLVEFTKAADAANRAVMAETDDASVTFAREAEQATQAIQTDADALGPIYGVAPEVVAKAGEYFRDQLHHVEVALADGRPFLMGEKFTSADILLTTCLDWAIAYGVGICDNAYPYLQRIRQRPGYQRGTAANIPPAALQPVRRPA